MKQPPLVNLKTEREYQLYYERVYCREPINTFDKISVYFRKSRFNHCFYESSKRNGVKDKFSRIRAERMDWIKATLKNPRAKLFQGWDKSKKRYDPSARVAIVFNNYVVIIIIRKNKKNRCHADFLTAYVAENSIHKILKSPEWKPMK